MIFLPLRGYTSDVKVLLAAAALLVSSDAFAAREQIKFLYCRAQVDCGEAAAGQVEALPRDSYLIAFTPDVPWIQSQKREILRDVNALLAYYGFPVTAKEIPVAEAERIMKLPLADVALKYRANSFLGTVGVLGEGVNNGGTDIHAVRKDEILGMVVFGPTQHWSFEKITVNPAFQMSDPKVSPRRKRAMLSVILTHEFVHAAHARLLETLVSGDPAPGLKPRRVIPIQAAVDTTMKAENLLGVSRVTGHMEEGLMAAGGEHKGNRNDEYGGSVSDVSHCLLDPRVSEAALDNLSALAASSQPCTERNYPAGDYFRLPATNRGLISRYLGKMKAAGCYAACYYDQKTEAAAMAAAKYSVATDPQYSLRAQLAPKAAVKIPMASPDARYKEWWEQVNAR